MLDLVLAVTTLHKPLVTGDPVSHSLPDPGPVLCGLASLSLTLPFRSSVHECKYVGDTGPSQPSSLDTGCLLSPSNLPVSSPSTGVTPHTHPFFRGGWGLKL